MSATHAEYATPLKLRPYTVMFLKLFITNRFYEDKSNRITVPTIFTARQHSLLCRALY